jgi:Ca2+-binding RTX toxin-like protein
VSRLSLRVLAALVAVAALGVLAVTFAAANTVPATNVGQIQLPIGANDLKPAACAGITLNTVVAGTTGGAGNDLVLGTAAADTLKGNGGNDCILGGGGNDSLNGGAGTDVCIGGPGTDSFNGTCETQVQ